MRVSKKRSCWHFDQFGKYRVGYAAPLLGGVRCLFLSVIFLLWKKRQSEAMLADMPRRFNRSRNSASVISGFTVTASKINCEYVSMRCDLRSPPWRLGRCRQLLEATVPADRANTKMLGSLSTGQATINCGDHPLAKINGKRLGHACWPPSPARSLNLTRAI